MCENVALGGRPACGPAEASNPVKASNDAFGGPIDLMRREGLGLTFKAICHAGLDTVVCK